MKKFISIILAVLMTLSLCACTGSGETAKEPEATFRVGYAREDITPSDGVPLGGYGDTLKRISTGYLDYLFATCIAVTDAQDNTVLLFSQDLIASTYYKEVRSNVSQATGIAEDNIMLCATHTHSGPDQKQSHSGITSWKTTYLAAVVKAAQAALEDRSAAEISIGRTQAEGLNFVRHYLQEGGTYVGDNFGSESAGKIIAHAEENDPEMQVIKFTRAAEDKKDIIMVNWQAHPCMTGGVSETNISADFIGSTREYVEKQIDCNFVYFTGAAGNQNVKSRIEGETPTTDVKEFGKLLGDNVLKALENMTPVASGEVKTTKLMYEGQVNHEMEEKLEQAREVQALYKATDRATGNKLAREYGFSSVYHCNGVISRATMGDTLTMGIHAISMGDISFITAPYEMFALHGRYIKDNTPFNMTFVLTCANGGNGYLPSVLAYDYGCYESHTGKFARGVGDDLAETFVEMLNEQKNG